MEQVFAAIKTAAKNVWYNKTKYIYFVVFLILIQSLLSSVILFNYNNNQNEIRYLENEYKVSNGSRYHIVMNNLTPNQRADLLNHYARFQEVKRYYKPVWQEQVIMGENDTTKRYNIYIYFDRPAEPDATPYDLYRRFMSSDLWDEEFGVVSLQETPYLLAYRSQAENNTLTVFLVLFITGIGTVMFAILFNTVVNHFKFSYGIYMTYGANFKKLLFTAVSEMLVINLATFILSFGLSILITWILTLRAGYGIRVLVYPMFLALGCSLLLTLLAVTVVMRRLSAQTPDKLIRSINNVGLITSPRFSKRIPQNGYPVKSEILSLKRFFKYIISLVLTTLIFAGVYCGGIYLMEAQKEKEMLARPQFELAFPTGGILQGDIPETSAAVSDTTTPSGEEEIPPILEYPQGYTYTSDVRNNLYAIDGVRYIVKDRGVLATNLKSHILLDKYDVSATLRAQGYKAEGGRYAFCNLEYKLLDEEVLDNIRFFGGSVVGDLDAALNDPYTVVISDSYNNGKHIKLKVGDTIRISVSYRYRRNPTNGPFNTYPELLAMHFRSWYFDYVDVKIGAIVSDLPCDEIIPLYMNEQTFTAVTKQTAFFADVSIYCDDGLDESAIQTIQRKLFDYQQYYKMSITNTAQDTVKTVQYNKNLPGIILYISLLLLLVSVLITVLNQTLFYQMRKQEFDVYLCLGSDFKRIRKLFLVDGTFFALLSAVFYSLFAFLSSALVFKVVNSAFGGAEIRYQFSLPLPAFFFGLLVTVGTAFFSVMLSYMNYKRSAAAVFTGKPVAALDDGDLASDKSVIFDSDIR